MWYVLCLHRSTHSYHSHFGTILPPVEYVSLVTRYLFNASCVSFPLTRFSNSDQPIYHWQFMEISCVCVCVLVFMMGWKNCAANVPLCQAAATLSLSLVYKIYFAAREFSRSSYFFSSG